VKPEERMNVFLRNVIYRHVQDYYGSGLSPVLGYYFAQRNEISVTKEGGIY
jgi:hypothetical protein